jgi:hypothetical protein
MLSRQCPSYFERHSFLGTPPTSDSPGCSMTPILTSTFSPWQPTNFPSVPVAATQHPDGLATHSLSFAPPQSPPVPFRRSVTLSSAQEMSRTALESLDQNALRAGDVQAGYKVPHDKSSGKEEVARWRVTSQVDRKEGAEGAGGEDGERGAGRSDEKLHLRVSTFHVAELLAVVGHLQRRRRCWDQGLTRGFRRSCLSNRV